MHPLGPLGDRRKAFGQNIEANWAAPRFVSGATLANHIGNTYDSIDVSFVNVDKLDRSQPKIVMGSFTVPKLKLTSGLRPLSRNLAGIAA